MATITDLSNAEALLLNVASRELSALKYWDENPPDDQYHDHMAGMLWEDMVRLLDYYCQDYSLNAQV